MRNDGIFKSRQQSKLQKHKNLEKKLNRMAPKLAHLSRGIELEKEQNIYYENKFFEAYSLVELAINSWESCETLLDRGYVERITPGWTIQGCMAIEYAIKYFLAGRKHIKTGKLYEELSNNARNHHNIVTLNSHLEKYNPDIYNKLRKYVEDRVHLLAGDKTFMEYSDLVSDLIYFQPNFRYIDFEEIKGIGEGITRRQGSIILFLVFFRGKLELGEIRGRVHNKGEVLSIEEIVNNKKKIDGTIMDFSTSFRQGEL